MKIVEPNNLSEEIFSLNHGEQIIVDVDRDKLQTSEYNWLRLQSMESLFNTCLVNNDMISNQFNLEKFLNQYSMAYSTFRTELDDELEMAIGTDAYKAIVLKGLSWNIDFRVGMLVISHKVESCSC